MIRIIIEIEEARQDQSFRERLQRQVLHDRRLLERLAQDPEPIRFGGGTLRFPR